MSDNTITTTVPTNADEVAALQRQAEADAPAYAALKVITVEDYAFADESLTEIVRRKDAAIEMRSSATKPLYQVIRTIEGWFRPLVQALEGAERHLKKEMGAYRVEQARLEREATAAAQLAAKGGDFGAAMEAAQIADDAAQKPAGARSRVAMKWAVKSTDVMQMPAQYLLPDLRGLSAFARKHKDLTNPPKIAGVEFELVADVAAKR